ncbi:uncharacterized protein LOC125225091 isoform X4 [Leguminivora glycinivorella]|uniref:uncharacterized protein LOC125225091 isoform X4 n=1 Tax=Leguminivora glycinivorella TaxID=1035111 RepID=UPI00200CE062|nr:uncharacterized protein LOC125225091 isoform X4 [Leguminivora glycinivorella]
MNRLILISAVCMQFGWIFGAPNPAGVGAYAYQDSDGNRVFKSNKEYQKKAFDASKKAYDVTSNQAGFMNFDFSRFPFNGGWGNYGMPNFGAQNFGAYGHNSAYASGSAMPGFSHQVVAINPANPGQPNVDIKNRFGEEGTGTGTGGNGGYMSVSSSSYATSSNVNGQEKNHRGAETVVNNNGVVHRYKVES